ncbi:MAG: hypothetical protein ACYC6G_07210 [Desulfobaccales bacterium]
MFRYWLLLQCCLRLCIASGLMLGWAALAQAMPAQVIIIRHAEKYEAPRKIHLSPKGRTRALGLAELFQSDPRVLEFGRPAAIIAQSPTAKKTSRRCLETVEPLAAALRLPVISRFTYGQAGELVQWLKEQRQYDGKAVLICMQHMEVDELAQALGVAGLRPRIWPHETYDRLYILTYAPEDGRLLSFRNLPQRLLFGDSYQDVAGQNPRDKAEVRFRQVYRVSLRNPAAGQKSLAPRWQFSFSTKIKGDFANFNDETIPVLRLGGFCFGYYLTTLGYLKKDPNAVVKINARARSGSLIYRYKTKAGDAERTYAWISFAWDKQYLRVKFWADVDEGSITPKIDPPITLEPAPPVGLIVGSTPCYVAFGPKKFQAPIGLNYQGLGEKAPPPASPGSYHATLMSVSGFLVEKSGEPENLEQGTRPGEPNAK